MNWNSFYQECCSHISGLDTITINNEKNNLGQGTYEFSLDNDFVGYQDGGTYGDMYFQRTLEDWAKFNINNRTKHDASISSGLAIMACNKHRYVPQAEKINVPVNLDFAKYDNKGNISQIIK